MENVTEQTEIEKIEADANDALTVAKAYVITNDEDNARAADFLRNIKTLQKEIEEHYEANIKRWHDGHKAAVAEKKEHLVPLQEAERFLKSKIGAYIAEQERIRQEEQRRLQEAARIEEERRRIEEAAMLETQGETQAAAEVLEDAVSAPAPLIFVPKAAAPVGISTREVWTYQIENEALIPRSFMVVDHAKIGKVVSAMKSEARIPGVRVFTQQQVAARRW